MIPVLESVFFPVVPEVREDAMFDLIEFAFGELRRVDADFAFTRWIEQPNGYHYIRGYLVPRLDDLR